MKQAEALLPNTDALPSNCAEMIEYKGKWLVRVRNAQGSTNRRTFPLGDAGRDEAHAFLLKEARKLQAAMQHCSDERTH